MLRRSENARGKSILFPKISLLVSLALPLLMIFLFLYFLTGTAAAKPVEFPDAWDNQPINSLYTSGDQPVNYPFVPDRLIIKLRSQISTSSKSTGIPSLDTLMAAQGVQNIRPLFQIPAQLNQLELPGFIHHIYTWIYSPRAMCRQS